jgi:UDP-N-acetylmuramoyl-L-alanyl-D-glutamate--2,6-diaminopimelate ligase
MINIKVDSRKVVPGDTFIALRGVSSDGHDYIDKAIKNGAIKIVAEEGNYSVDTIIVSNTREYLINYLKDNYNKFIDKMTIIGITGTNGKTTSAFLTSNALNMLGKKSAYIGTLGFYITEKIYGLDNTTPDILELYNMFMEAYEQNCKCVVLEVSSQGLGYNRVEGFLFDYAVFTNLTQDHLDYHKTMENYALAKQKLFKKLKTNGKAIINYDDEYKNYYILNENNNITYGFEGGDYQVQDFNMTNLGTTFQYNHNNKIHHVVTPLIGRYNVYNLLVTIIILKELQFKDNLINDLLPKLKAPAGRMDTIKYGTNSIIIDYAHTPDAIIKIVNTMADVTIGNIYVVFGCTGDRDRTKRPLMTEIVTSKAKLAILTNDDPHNEDPYQIIDDMTKNLIAKNYEVILDRRQAIIRGIKLLEENDVLLILGKGHEEVMIVKDQKIPFNDRKEATDYIKQINSVLKN